MYRIEADRIQQYVADEFVVAIPHRDLVLQRITDGGVSVKAEDRRLGLSLIHVADVGRALAQIRADRAAAGAPAPRPARDGASALELERLLGEVRAYFAHTYGRWIPTIGKNRVIHGVQLFPYPSFGGSGLPSWLPADTPLPSASGDRSAGRDARVAILDTGIYPHPLLAGRYLAEPDSLLAADPEVRQWWAGHATFVAGLVTQRAPGARLEVKSVLGADGRAANVWDVAQTLVGYAGSGVDIINVSFGCFTIDGEPPLVLDRAIARLTPEIVVVAAGGNYGDADPGDSPDALPGSNTPIWPAAYGDVVAVGADDADGKPASFTPRVPWLDLMAPGVDVTSTYLQGWVKVAPEAPPADKPATAEAARRPATPAREFFGIAQWRGTSFAAATVTGAIAARTARGRRTAYQALEELRRGTGERSGTGIHPPTAGY